METLFLATLEKGQERDASVQADPSRSRQRTAGLLYNTLKGGLFCFWSAICILLNCTGLIFCRRLKPVVVRAMVRV